MAKFKKILEICKQYAGNQVNGKRKFSIWSIIYVVILYLFFYDKTISPYYFQTVLSRYYQF